MADTKTAEPLKFEPTGNIGIGDYIVPDTALHIRVEQPTARLYIQDDILIELLKVPNLWRRLWYWLLLGWKWKEIND